MSEINLTLSNANSATAPAPTATASAPPSAASEAAPAPPAAFTAAPSAPVQALMSQIDLRDSTTSLCYGRLPQSKLDQYIRQSLQATARCDIDKVSTLLVQIGTLVRDFDDANRQNRGFSVFRSAKKRTTLEAQYTQASRSIEQIEKELEGQRLILLVDIKLLGETYQQLLRLCDNLTTHIEAGQRQLAAVRQGELAELRRQAESGIEQSALLYNNLAERCDNFELRLQDLELTKTISLQAITQIQLSEQANTQLAQKIQSSLSNTIPLWRQSIAAALTVQHYQEELASNNGQLLGVIDDTLGAYQNCRKQVNSQKRWYVSQFRQSQTS